MIIPFRIIYKGIDKVTNAFVKAPGTDRQKSISLSVFLFGMLLLIMFFIRFWPPSDAELASLMGGGGGGGVTVNFGDSDFGTGSNYQSEVLDIKDNNKITPTQATQEEDIISQDDNADKTDVVIPKHDTPKKETKPIIKKDVKPEVVKPKVNNNANDALSSILHGSNNGGDGNTKTAGNQGSANGSLGSNGYYGTGGSGGGTGGGNGNGNGTGTGSGSGSGSGGGNGSGHGLGTGSGYSLAGRKALSIPNPTYNCNEEGTVVVQITVDKNGKTIDAKPGYRGTTNTASCLASQAKIAAMNSKWDIRTNGDDNQVGTITFNFKLRD